MHSLKALLFPECTPIGSGPSFLLTFFDDIGYFPPSPHAKRPNILPQGEGLFSPIDPFLQDEDNDRFESLVRELEGRGREYYLHTLSAMSSASDGSEESSVSSLISMLTQTPLPESPTSRKDRQRRWQARLILQLSVMLAEEEDEISQEVGKFTVVK